MRLMEAQAVQPVERPIICSPYDWPMSHWAYDNATGKAYRADYRRPAGYYYKTELTGVQSDLFAEEERDDLPLVNALREDVARWRKAGYRGATNSTKQLLRHWSSDRLPRRLFFCQVEAVETLIYLAELGLPGRLRGTGFQNFQLSEDDLGKMLRAEKPSFPTAQPDFHPTLIDMPVDQRLQPLLRMACKMATGSGKTVVMAMLIAWAFCNRKSNPRSEEFPDGVLVCCPNLTVKERLQVLKPEDPYNYYEAFDLVPVPMRPALMAGKVLVENWHGFGDESPHKEGDKTYAVVDKGPETDLDVARRVLGELFDHMPIMVLNDEGHHCWRPKPIDESTVEKMTAEEKKTLEDERKEARVWLAGLDRINNALGVEKRGIRYCIDLSATPFYIKGTGYPEGRPFPWIVSDFGLMDAIESGIVKIPRIPVGDDARERDEIGRPDPKYFRLWRNIVDNAPPGKKQAGGKPKPEYAYEQAEGALKQIAGQWLERFQYYQEAKPGEEQIPPVLIIVCDNTDIAEVFYRKISGETEELAVSAEDIEAVLGDGEEAEEEDESKAKSKKPKKKTVFGRGAVFPDHFSNTKERRYTRRIDSKLLAEAESEEASKSRQAAADELRKVIATVGRKGQPGEHVRCVVSVGMLTEGWDANNVTHILGVRAFGSQLLCEQVVGRGLRRLSYETEWDAVEQKHLLQPEYVDVYGIPFSVIPYKGRPVDTKAPDDKPSYRVYGMPEREEFEIRFPVVENYVFELNRPSITCDIAAIEPITISPKLEPLKTFVSPTLGTVDRYRAGSSEVITVQDRQRFYDSMHLQEILFVLTQNIVDDLLSTESGTDQRSRVLRLQARHQLFPQVLAIVDEFVGTRVNFNGVDEREVFLEKYMRLLKDRIRDSIRPAEDDGEAPLLPILNRYTPVGSTSKASFTTRCPVMDTVKSQINLVVAHSDWEHQAARVFEEMCEVESYARNERLYLTVRYDWRDEPHDYTPDFIVRMRSGLQILLEIKGYDLFEPERDNQKQTAARKWVDAVNNLAEFGQWKFEVCRDIAQLPERLRELDITRSRQSIGVASA